MCLTLRIVQLRQPKKLASKEAKIDFTRPDREYSDELLRSTLMSLDGMVRFYDRGGSREWEDIRIAMEEMHLLDGINIFILDPLTALVSRYTASEANDKLNEICTDMADFVNKYPVTLFCYSHVNPKPKTSKPHEAGARVYSSEFTGSHEQWKSGFTMDTASAETEQRNVHWNGRTFQSSICYSIGTLDNRICVTFTLTNRQ